MPIYLPTYLPTYMKAGREEMARKKCARDTFPSHFDRISRFDDGELELPQIEMEAKGLRGRLDGIARIRPREQSRKIVAGRVYF